MTGPLLQPDAALLRSVFGNYPSGVAALCAIVDGEPRGFVATSFSMGTSFDPPLVMLSVQNSSTTWPVLRHAASIGVSVLGSGHEEACRRLASRTGDRFEHLDIVEGAHAELYLTGAASWITARPVSEVPAGDHAIVVLEVLAASVHDGIEPLVYHGSRFRSLAAS